MQYINIGKIVNTHGIKGEIRLLSDFQYKDNVFQNGFKIYIGKEKQEEVIETYRHHKIFDMLTLKGIYNINDVLKYKGKRVYVKRENLQIDGYLDEELIGLKVYQNQKLIGVIHSIMKNHQNGILVIEHNKKRNFVPNLPEFIESIDLQNQRMNIKYIEGLIHED